MSKTPARTATKAQAGSTRRRAPGAARDDKAAPGQTGADELSGRDRLLLAGVREFATKGFEGTSVLEIAKAAGVKQPLLNYHFGGKEGLWHAVLHAALAEPTAHWVRLHEGAQGENPLDDLRLVLRNFGTHVAQYPEAHQLIFREAALAGPRLDWLVSNYIRPFHDMLDEAIAKCRRQGWLRDGPPAFASILMTNMLTSVSSAFPLVQRLYGVKRMSPTDAEAYVDGVIDVLLNGMLARSPDAAASKVRTPAASQATKKDGAVTRRSSAGGRSRRPR